METPEINAPLLRVALAVLRSGLIPQATGKLCRLNSDGTVKGMCCLGVLTHVAIHFGGLKLTEIDHQKGSLRAREYNSGTNSALDYLLPEVSALYGFAAVNPALEHEGRHLSASAMNDANIPHPVIADAFERTFLPQDVKGTE